MQECCVPFSLFERAAESTGYNITASGRRHNAGANGTAEQYRSSSPSPQLQSQNRKVTISTHFCQMLIDFEERTRE